MEEIFKRNEESRRREKSLKDCRSDDEVNKMIDEVSLRLIPKSLESCESACRMLEEFNENHDFLRYPKAVVLVKKTVFILNSVFDTFLESFSNPDYENLDTIKDSFKFLSKFHENLTKCLQIVIQQHQLTLNSLKPQKSRKLYIMYSELKKLKALSEKSKISYESYRERSLSNLSNTLQTAEKIQKSGSTLCSELVSFNNKIWSLNEEKAKQLEWYLQKNSLIPSHYSSILTSLEYSCKALENEVSAGSEELNSTLKSYEKAQEDHKLYLSSISSTTSLKELVYLSLVYFILGILLSQFFASFKIGLIPSRFFF